MTAYIGVNKGGPITAVAVGTSTVSKDVELVVNTTNITAKSELIRCLRALEGRIIKGTWPPA